MGIWLPRMVSGCPQNTNVCFFSEEIKGSPPSQTWPNAPAKERGAFPCFLRKTRRHRGGVPLPHNRNQPTYWQTNARTFFRNNPKVTTKTPLPPLLIAIAPPPSQAPYASPSGPPPPPEPPTTPGKAKNRVLRPKWEKDLAHGSRKTKLPPPRARSTAVFLGKNGSAFPPPATAAGAPHAFAHISRPPLPSPDLYSRSPLRESMPGLLPW